MTPEQNINSKAYWDCRFGSGDWVAKGGTSQTRLFAEHFVSRLDLPKDFSGVICDFGCGTGDAIPIYRAAFPLARLIGVDFSAEAVRLCRQNYSNIADFFDGDYSVVPPCDVVITSNVIEHILDDENVVGELLKRCNILFVIVPYREQFCGPEHLRVYDKSAFSKFPVLRREVYASKGWSEYGRDLFIGIYLKNLLRPFFGKPLLWRHMQILFEIRPDRSAAK